MNCLSSQYILYVKFVDEVPPQVDTSKRCSQSTTSVTFCNQHSFMDCPLQTWLANIIHGVPIKTVLVNVMPQIIFVNTTPPSNYVCLLLLFFYGLSPSECMCLSILFMDCHLQTACACQYYSWTPTFRLYVLVNIIRGLAPSDCMCLSILFMD